VTAFGDLQIAASAKIGEAGPFEGGPVLYYWPWYRHLPSVGPWLLLALAIALPRANRHRHALLIFIPLLVLGLLWQRVTKLTGMPSASETQFSFFIDSLAVGMALLWLHADKLGGYHSVPRFLVSLGILLLADLVVVLSYWGAFPGQSSMLPVCTAVMSIVLLISLALTRRLAHKRYDPIRFMLWLAAWSTACSIAGVAALVGVLMLTTVYPIHDPLAVLVQMIVPGLVVGLCLYAVNLPYMLLMFSSPFFRRRFRVWLGVAAES
jgi:peptidoglycan/LPS O-acetylase OafA/YrhL